MTTISMKLEIKETLLNIYNELNYFQDYNDFEKVIRYYYFKLIDKINNKEQLRHIYVYFKGLYLTIELGNFIYYTFMDFKKALKEAFN